jgi:hypothetical protein
MTDTDRDLREKENILGENPNEPKAISQRPDEQKKHRNKDTHE